MKPSGFDMIELLETIKEKKTMIKILFICHGHSSFTIMQDFAKLGRVRHNMSGNRINTTVWTTKAHKQNRDKGKCVGRIH